jgi:hypothetical protein
MEALTADGFDVRPSRVAGTVGIRNPIAGFCEAHSLL